MATTKISSLPPVDTAIDSDTLVVVTSEGTRKILVGELENNYDTWGGNLTGNAEITGKLSITGSHPSEDFDGVPTQRLNINGFNLGFYPGYNEDGIFGSIDYPAALVISGSESTYGNPAVIIKGRPHFGDGASTDFIAQGNFYTGGTTPRGYTDQFIFSVSGSDPAGTGGIINLGSTNEALVISFQPITRIHGHVTASGDIKVIGSYYGDGSNLTGVLTNPFVGDVVITGSLTVSGSGTLRNTGPRVQTGSEDILIRWGDVTGTEEMPTAVLIGETLTYNIQYNDGENKYVNPIFRITASGEDGTLVGDNAEIHLGDENTNFNTDLNVIGIQNIKGDLKPKSSDGGLPTYDLGKSNQTWKEVHAETGSLALLSTFEVRANEDAVALKLVGQTNEMDGTKTITIPGLPTTDPQDADVLWVDNGNLKISLGEPE